VGKSSTRKRKNQTKTKRERQREEKKKKTARTEVLACLCPGCSLCCWGGLGSDHFPRIFALLGGVIPLLGLLFLWSHMGLCLFPD